MKTYRVDIEFTSPAYVVADTEEDYRVREV